MVVLARRSTQAVTLCLLVAGSRQRVGLIQAYSESNLQGEELTCQKIQAKTIAERSWIPSISGYWVKKISLHLSLPALTLTVEEAREGQVLLHQFMVKSPSPGCFASVISTC